MIQIAVMTFMYRSFIASGEITHEQLVKMCAENGAAGLEIFHKDFIDNPQNKALYRGLLADNGLSLPVMDVIVNLVYGDKAGRQLASDGLRQGLDICAEMGTSIAHVAGCKPVAEVPLDDARKMIADLLAEHTAYARERGATLAFEDFDPSPSLICSADDCLAILRQAGDEVKFVFDTGNFMAAGESADDNIDRLYPHCVHFHFKDYKRIVKEDGTPGRKGVALGEGDTPNKAVASEILRRGYQGWVALESLGAGSPGERIGRDLPTLRNWLQLD